jgi:hypothetical protein
MSDLLPGLLTLSTGGSVAPPLLFFTNLFLSSCRPLHNAGALALGYFALYAVTGILGLVLFGRAAGAVSTVGRVTSVTVGVLLLILGFRSLLIASNLGPEG